jgi:hypothetical protein
MWCEHTGRRQCTSAFATGGQKCPSPGIVDGLDESSIAMVYDSCDHLTSRIDHLERQLAFYRDLARRHNAALVDVRMLLDSLHVPQHATDSYSSTVRRVDQLLGQDGTQDRKHRAAVAPGPAVIHESQNADPVSSLDVLAVNRPLTVELSSKPPLVPELGRRNDASQVAVTPPPGRPRMLPQDRAVTATPRSSTPSRHSRNSQDSSQVRTAIFGETLTSASTPRRHTGNVEIEQLQRQLAQLELQLGLVCGRRGESGSESKYFALSRKTEKVRADLARKQRAREEDEAVLDAIESQRRFRAMRM